MDVDAIDFCRVALGHGPGDGDRHDLVVERLALGRRHGLRVGKAGDVAIRV